MTSISAAQLSSLLPHSHHDRSSRSLNRWEEAGDDADADGYGNGERCELKRRSKGDRHALGTECEPAEK